MCIPLSVIKQRHLKAGTRVVIVFEQDLYATTDLGKLDRVCSSLGQLTYINRSY